MPVKLADPDPVINVDQMQDGELAVVRVWDSNQKHIGAIVQRYGMDLINVGKPFGSGWSGFFRTASDGVFRVELLKPGTLIEVTQD